MQALPKELADKLPFSAEAKKKKYSPAKIACFRKCMKKVGKKAQRECLAKCMKKDTKDTKKETKKETKDGKKEAPPEKRKGGGGGGGGGGGKREPPIRQPPQQPQQVVQPQMMRQPPLVSLNRPIRTTPSGSVVFPDGSYITKEGKKVSAKEATKEGRTTTMGGSVVTPRGTVIDPEGNVRDEQGNVQMSDVPPPPPPTAPPTVETEYEKSVREQRELDRRTVEMAEGDPDVPVPTAMDTSAPAPRPTLRGLRRERSKTITDFSDVAPAVVDELAAKQRSALAPPRTDWNARTTPTGQLPPPPVGDVPPQGTVVADVAHLRGPEEVAKRRERGVGFAPTPTLGEIATSTPNQLVRMGEDLGISTGDMTSFLEGAKRREKEAIQEAKQDSLREAQRQATQSTDTTASEMTARRRTVQEEEEEEKEEREDLQESKAADVAESKTADDGLPSYEEMMGEDLQLPIPAVRQEYGQSATLRIAGERGAFDKHFRSYDRVPPPITTEQQRGAQDVMGAYRRADRMTRIREANATRRVERYASREEELRANRRNNLEKRAAATLALLETTQPRQRARTAPPITTEQRRGAQDIMGAYRRAERMTRIQEFNAQRRVERYASPQEEMRANRRYNVQPAITVSAEPVVADAGDVQDNTTEYAEID